MNINGTDYPVTAIGDNAFSSCDALQSIDLPEGLQTIGYRAFDGCDALQSVDIPQGVTVIGEDAFSYCSALQSVILPEGLQSIGESAFEDCTSLESITLPEGLQNIDSYAFSRCTSLQSIILPEGLQNIDSYAFSRCTSLQSIILPEGLQAIGWQIFRDCTALESVTLPESLQSIGHGAFYGCPLQDITCLAATPPAIDGSSFDSDTYANAALHVPAGAWAAYQADPYWERLIRYPKIDGVQYYIDFAAQEASVTGADTGITSATIPTTVEHEGTSYPVTAIGNQVFRDNSALQSVTIPEGLKVIGEMAFYGCTALQSIILPESLQTIGWEAFYGCPLQDITCLAATPPAISSNTFDSDTYANATLHVPAEAWATYQADPYWERLIRYPEIGGVQYYIGFATQEASVSGTNESITTANILASVEYDGTEYPVIAIENEAFASCQSLQSVTFPEGLQSIGEEAFYGCTTLQNIDIPQSVTKIGSSTFSGCSALQSVTIPEGVIYIGSSTFSGCRSLTSIDLPSTMQEIGSGAFEDTGLRDVYSRALTPPVINDDTFSQSTYRLATLYVPAEAVENYRSAMGWVLFDHIESDLPPVSITNVATGASLARYANGILTTSGLADITVYAQSGAVVRHAADATSLSLEGLPHGIYIICVAQGRQQQVMKVAR